MYFCYSIISRVANNNYYIKRLLEARKADKQQKLDSDVGALIQYSRIKVRASGGVFAVTLVNVYEDRRMVEVVWDQGLTKEFRYSSVVWSDQPDDAVQEKPTCKFVWTFVWCPWG